MRNIKYIAVHCAATKPSMDVPASRVREWHLKRGWKDIGYHFYIRRSGLLELGRNVAKVGAHVYGWNTVSIGICWEGGINEAGDAEDNRTEAQLLTLHNLLLSLGSSYPKAIIKGHRDFPKVSKACPSFDVKEWCGNVGIECNW